MRIIILYTACFWVINVIEVFPQQREINYFDSTNAVILNQEPFREMTIEINNQTPIIFSTYKSSSYIWSGYIARYNNIFYNLGYKEEEKILTTGQHYSIKVMLIQTIDDKFISPEGLKVGDSIKKLMEKYVLNKSDIYCNSECIELPSGWKAIFCKAIKNINHPTREDLDSVIICFIK